MIRLSNDLWVDANKECYIVGKLGKRKKKVGSGYIEEDFIMRARYFNTMEKVAKYAISFAMRDLVESNVVQTLGEFIEAQKQINAEMNEKLGVLK